MMLAGPNPNQIEDIGGGAATKAQIVHQLWSPHDGGIQGLGYVYYLGSDHS